MRFKKKSGDMQWQTFLKNMTQVNAMVGIDGKDYSFGCGINDNTQRENVDTTVDPTSEAWAFKIKDSGKVDWMLKVSGGSPYSGVTPADSCHGMTYSKETGELAALL